MGGYISLHTALGTPLSDIYRLVSVLLKLRVVPKWRNGSKRRLAMDLGDAFSSSASCAITNKQKLNSPAEMRRLAATAVYIAIFVIVVSCRR